MDTYRVLLSVLLGDCSRSVIKMEWLINTLPPKIYRYNLGKNPKKSFYLFLSACIAATIILGILACWGWMSPHAGLGVKIFGTVLTAWALFLGYWGALVSYDRDIRQAHKIKWENGKVYTWNKYVKKVFVYSFEEINDIIFTHYGVPIRYNDEPTEMGLMIKTKMPLIPIRTPLNIALGMEIGLRLKEDWERWRKGQKP